MSAARKPLRNVLTAAFGVLVIAAAGSIWRCGGRDNHSTGEGGGGEVALGVEGDRAADIAVPVQADTVRRGKLVLRVAATGQTEAVRRSKITARVAGRIVTLPVEEGSRTVAGRVLVSLDPREYALAVEEAEAAFQEAEARYREMTLFDDRIEDPGVREERAVAGRAKSGLDRAEIALRRARLDLSNTTSTAPFSGHIADLQAVSGEYATAGQELMTVVDIDPIQVEVQVIESELRWLSEGAGATVRLPAFPDTAFAGRIESINPVVDPGSRTGRVTIVIRNPDSAILPGMYARVSLEGRAFEDRVLVPREAILERDGRTLVFLLEPLPDGPSNEGLAKWVYVTPGLGNDEVVELIEGEGAKVPPPGSVVITGGHFTLTHDAQVRVQEPDGR